MAIKSCTACGGLYTTEPLEMFAGTPCRCAFPSSNEIPGHAQAPTRSAEPFDLAKRDPWFWRCVSEAMETPEFVEQWRRLRGYPIARSPIEAMVDKACDVERERAREFIRDVYDTIYTRIPRPSMTESAE